MKNQSITLVVAILALTSILFALGCSPAPQNTNQPRNTNANGSVNANGRAETNAANVAILEDSACSESNLGERRKRVEEKILEKIEQSGNLRPQYQAQRFKYQVVVVPGANSNTLHLYIEGKITGDDSFVDLSRIIRSFVGRKCASRVRWVKTGTLPVAPDALSIDPGFEWTACDYPNEPCPNGECKQPGQCSFAAAESESK
jgi:hypothetical protein